MPGVAADSLTAGASLTIDRNLCGRIAIQIHTPGAEVRFTASTKLHRRLIRLFQTLRRAAFVLRPDAPKSQLEWAFDGYVSRILLTEDEADRQWTVIADPPGSL